MPVHSNPMEDYARAVALERAAWEAVRHHLPGCAAYDDALWKRWRQAVDESDRAAARAKGLLSASPAPLPLSGKAKPDFVRLPPILTRSLGERKA